MVGVDPAVSSKEGSDDTGIIVAGKGTDGQGYVLGDYTLHDTPKAWAEAVITAYNKHKANIIIGEVNNGGDLVEMNIKAVNPMIPFEAVHASRGKATRAEPISALYEQNLIHHFGTFPELEKQMCEWVPGTEKSPDRVDALVWALSTLDLAPWHFSDNTGNYNEVGYGISESIDGVYKGSFYSGRSCSNYSSARDYLQREDINF